MTMVRVVVIWFKLYFNCYKYKHIIAENIKYPGSDKKPKACTKVISWQVDIICKSFINGRRASRRYLVMGTK